MDLRKLLTTFTAPAPVIVTDLADLDRAFGDNHDRNVAYIPSSELSELVAAGRLKPNTKAHLWSAQAPVTHRNDYDDMVDALAVLCPADEHGKEANRDCRLCDRYFLEAAEEVIESLRAQLAASDKLVALPIRERAQWEKEHEVLSQTIDGMGDENSALRGQLDQALNDAADADELQARWAQRGINAAAEHAEEKARLEQNIALRDQAIARLREQLADVADSRQGTTADVAPALAELRG